MQPDQKPARRVKDSELGRQEAVTGAVAAVLGHAEAERLSAEVYAAEEEARELSSYELHLIRKCERKFGQSGDRANA